MIYKGSNLIAGGDLQVTKEYVRNQNELGPNRSAQYSWVISNEFAQAQEMPYDGYISISIPSLNKSYTIYIYDKNGTQVTYASINNRYGAERCVQLSFTKGQYIGIGGTPSYTPPAPDATEVGLFFYEKRDYSFRGLTAEPPSTGVSVTKKYVCDQVELDVTNEAQFIAEATSPDTAVQMPYDGVISFGANDDASAQMYILNANKVKKYRCELNSKRNSSAAAQMQFNKGDYIYKTGKVISPYIRFYKKRDYTGR